jgi:polyhydroxybutyrate depolymerase
MLGRTPRSMTRLVASLFSILFLLLVSPVLADKLVPGLKEHTFGQDGLKRSYLLYTPFGINRQPDLKRPVVLVIHGGGGDHRSMVGMTGRRFNRLADKHGFFVVYPNAVDRSWNFGKGLISASLKTKADDAKYFQTVLDQVATRVRVDEKRVFATGISRGGQACYFLAGKFPDRFRAIAPVTMPLPGYLADDCREGPPIALALFNGTGDPLVPYAGGWIQIAGKKRDEVLSTSETIDIWLKRNGCSPKDPDTTTKIDKPGDRTTIVKKTWACKRAPVCLYTIENGGHTWPGGTQYLPVKVVGEVSKDIDGADEIWKFFSQF